jgi:hypothetical protein
MLPTAKVGRDKWSITVINSLNISFGWKCYETGD